MFLLILINLYFAHIIFEGGKMNKKYEIQTVYLLSYTKKIIQNLLITLSN